MTSRMCTLIGLLFVCVWASAVRADVVFPARLEMVESQPGLFDVQFDLPVQNQARVKATPVLPPVCVATGPQDVEFTETAYRVVWQVKCSAEALPGQTVEVEGLLGSQTDVLLSIKTLKGRQYSALLKPAKAKFVIPQAPLMLPLTGTSFVDGMRACFYRIELLLLIWLAVLFGQRFRAVVVALIAGGITYGVALVMARENLLMIPASLPTVAVLLLSAALASFWGRGHEAGHTSRVPAWVVGGFIGALYGGILVLNAGQGTLEYSRFEQGWAFCASIIGVMVGLLLLFLVCIEFRQCMGFIKGLPDSDRARRMLGTVTGGLALGGALYQLSAFSVLPTLVPTASPILFVTVVVLGLYVGHVESGGLWCSLAIGLMLVAGLVAGALGWHLPFDAVIVPLTLFALGVGLVTKRQLPPRIMVAIMAFAAFIVADQVGVFIQENLSKPVAQMAGNGVLAGCLLLLSASFAVRKDSQFSLSVRLVGVVGSVVALGVWGQGYAHWLNTTFVSDYAMGFIRIPVVSLVFVLMAVVLWPRRSRVAAHLNANRRKPLGHGVLLVLAVFCLNVGTIQAQNPMFKPQAPGPEQARRILESVLTNTYSAFNLKDEEQLYQQLSESVGEDLVETLYLDSRRRLTSGVRKGAEVTVKKVSVLSCSTALGEGMRASGEFAYDVEWVVIARVRHLQHVHHRQNLYTGVLAVRVTDGKWKVQQVDLKSEERAIVSGAAL